MFLSCLSKILLPAVSCWLLCPGLVDLLSCMSCVVTHVPLHPLTSHLKGFFACVAPLRRGRKRERRKLPLPVPQPSPLARHDNAVRPSFFFRDPVGERRLFYYQQRKRSPPSQRLVFLWRWSKAEGKTERRKRRRESSGKI